MSTVEELRMIRHYRRQLNKAHCLQEQFVSDQPVLDEVVDIRRQRLGEAMNEARSTSSE